MMRVVCAGTFDKLHAGHISYLKAAKELVGKDSKERAELIVIVARDSTSERIKGKKTENDEEERVKRVRDLDFVDQAVLGYKSGGKEGMVDRVVSLRPDIVALGYDQWAKEEWLERELNDKGLKVKIIRMPKFDE